MMASSLPSPSADDRAAWLDHLDRLTLRNGRMLSILLSVAGLPWAAFDYLVFDRQFFWTNAGWRVTLVLTGGTGLFIVPRVAWMRARPTAVYLTLGAIQLAATEYFCSQLDVLRWPAFFYSFFVNLCLAFFPLPLGKRLAVTFAYAVTLLASFLGPHPELAREAIFLPSLCGLVGAQGMSIILGVVLERLERSNFFQARALASRASLQARLICRSRSRSRRLVADRPRPLRRPGDRLPRQREVEIGEDRLE